MLFNLESNERYAFIITIIIGISTALYLYNLDKYSLVYFGDAVSHMVGARKLLDWREPGLQQLGTVWLPLPHLLLLPSTLIDPLFTSGFAGLTVSLPSFGITSTLLYKMARNHGMPFPLIVAMLYSTNPNIVYLCITAMTEAPFMLFFLSSAYYLHKWLEYRFYRYLIYSSILLSLATLCRYEGWILPLFFIIIVIVMTLKNRAITQAKACIILSSLISISGILVWLIYNLSIYGDPLEFANAEYYSASYQASNRSIRDTLFLQPINVFSVYGITALFMYGPILLGTAFIGYFIHRYKALVNISMKSQSIIYIFLGLPPLFTLIMLLLGIGEMTLWFNSRFLILLAPLVILLTSIFLNTIYRMFRIENRRVLLHILILASLFGFQLYTLFSGKVITYLDAAGGFFYHTTPYAVEVGEVLNSLYDCCNIMMLTGSPQEHRIMVTSGIALKEFDEMIESSIWKRSYYEPWLYNKWIVISKDPDSDGIKTTKYWAEERRMELNKHYEKVYENKFYEILVRRYTK